MVRGELTRIVSAEHFTDGLGAFVVHGSAVRGRIAFADSTAARWPLTTAASAARFHVSANVQMSFRHRE